MQKESEMNDFSTYGLDEETLKAMEAALDEVEAERMKEEEPKTPEMILLEHIQKINRKEERVVSKKHLLLTPPTGIEKDQMKEMLDGMSENEAFSTLGTITLSKDTYFYDKNLMTDHFAEVQALIEDKDILTTIATLTRHDCKVYPRPVKMSVFTLPPYRYSMDEIYGALARMKFKEGFEDIDTVEASNGNLCIYSKNFMSTKYARSLAEYIEVERDRDL